MEKKEIHKILPIVALIIILGLVTIIVIDLYPLIRDVINNSHDESAVIDYIHAYGAKGVPILIIMQFLFALIPFLPVAPMQMLSGLCYGIWIGTLICIIGIVLSNTLLFFLTRKYGEYINAFLHHKSNKTHIKSHSTLNEKIKNPTRMVFILYLIPVIPSAILPCIFAKTSISYHKFLLNMTMASIPVTLLYAWFGERLSKGDYKMAIILACVIIVLVIFFVIFKKKILTPNKPLDNEPQAN